MPGLDSFPMHFFQKFRETIKGDLLKLCKDFYVGKANLKIINWASITLIPKV